MSERARHRRCMGAGAALACTVLFAAGAAPAPQPSTPPAPQPAGAEPDAWSPRLSSLDPAKPRAYFELAEEIAAEGPEPAPRNMARHLYVLAYELDRRADTSSGAERLRLGPSVCLGLAAIARRPEEKRWLLALAQAMDDRQAPASSAGAAPGAGASSSSGDDAAFSLATVIGLARSGEGRKAERLLERPDVAELLDHYDHDSGLGSGLAAFVRRAIREWPLCPQCGNKRVVRAGTRQGEVALCDTCRGNPGPAVSPDEMVRQLRVESALLGGAHRSWASQVIADGGAPLRDLDPSELAATYNVDPTKPLWRDGTWTAPEGAPKAPPPAKAPGAAPER